MIKEAEFFKGKRPWSKIKDKVIGDYLVPYLRKVSRLRRKIIIVDAFAGQGIFEDGTKGSPLIICEIAEREVAGQYFTIFVNMDRKSHQKLKEALKEYIQKETALPILGNAEDLLKELSKIIGNATLLIYLDPFGLKGCEFELLEPYLGRDQRFSTEIIINMSMPTLHRLSAFKAIQKGKITDRVKKLNQRLTKVLGGEYWKEIMWSNLSPEEKEQLVIKNYVQLLQKYLPFAGFCPVRERKRKRVKYYIIFCSRHQDALLLMNDIMCKAYFKRMHEIQYRGTLFEGKFDWRETQKRGDIRDIKKLILEGIKKNPGITRKALWLEIVKSNFMKWIHSEYRNAINEMVNKKIKFISETSRLNDNAQLYLIENPLFLKSQCSKIKIHWKKYSMLNGSEKTLVEKVNDGSIIKRFDKTPLPKKATDVVCPHFLELKWAYGCPFDCSWCYLKGTFRFRPEGTRPAFKPIDKVKKHVGTFLQKVETPELLNTGEIADSLMGENKNPPFSKFIIPLFESQNCHKVLFVTKSTKIDNLLELPSFKQVIISFSLNAFPVAKKWELKAPEVKERIKAASKLYQKGYTIRLRIDPMVPIKNWEKHYFELIDSIFEYLYPERITLGSLRGLQSTINGAKDKSWTTFLQETSNWGKKISFTTRYEMYREIIDYLKNLYHYSAIALCKETKAMWERLKLNWENIRCNCVL